MGDSDFGEFLRAMGGGGGRSIDGPDRSPEEETAYRKKLRLAWAKLAERQSFKPGDMVTWKAGMKNKRSSGPFVVVEVLPEPILNEGDNGTPYFREPMDLVLGSIDSEGDFLCFHYDSRRMELIEEA